MSNTRLRDRIFAGFGAALFLITSVAFTAYAIVQTGGNSSTDSANTATTDPGACGGMNQTATAAPLTAPEVVKYSDKVAELQKIDIEPGTGPAAKAGDCLQMKYYGTLAAAGTLFDENFTKTSAFELELGAGQVIPGWDEGLVGLKEGGVRRLVIPAAKGYGEQGSGAIPPNTDLVFVVKLVKIK